MGTALPQCEAATCWLVLLAHGFIWQAFNFEVKAALNLYGHLVRSLKR